MRFERIKFALIWIPFFFILFFLNFSIVEIDIETCVKYSTEKYKMTPRSITCRRHEFRETNSNFDPDLEITPLSVAQLQNECCPQISASDLLSLINASKKSENTNYVTIDIRNLDEYNCLSLPGSIHIPFNTVSFSEKEVRTLLLAIPHRTFQFEFSSNY